MGVSNDQVANQDTFNNAFMARNADTDTTGKVDLLNVVAASGAGVTNAQRELNSLATFLGKALNAVYNLLPAWATNNFGTNVDTVFARIEAIDAAFTPASGSQAVRAGNAPIANGDASVVVAFSSAWPDANYVVVFSIQNTAAMTDNFLEGVITARTVNGFTVTFNAPADTANYSLQYIARKAS